MQFHQNDNSSKNSTSYRSINRSFPSRLKRPERREKSVTSTDRSRPTDNPRSQIITKEEIGTGGLGRRLWPLEKMSIPQRILVFRFPFQYFLCILLLLQIHRHTECPNESFPQINAYEFTPDIQLSEWVVEYLMNIICLISNSIW